MDVLDRITQMRLERDWSEYQLAKSAGITQSTISSWYRKKTTPSVPSLQKICKGFGISMSQFFLMGEMEGDETVVLNKQQLRMLDYASRLNPAQYEELLSFLLSLHPDA